MAEILVKQMEFKVRHLSESAAGIVLFHSGTERNAPASPGKGGAGGSDGKAGWGVMRQDFGTRSGPPDSSTNKVYRRSWDQRRR